MSSLVSSRTTQQTSELNKLEDPYVKPISQEQHATSLGIRSSRFSGIIMLRKLRRGSKGSAEDVAPPVRVDSAMAIPLDSVAEDTTMAPKLCFFDLPAELRNAIYEFVISDATLSLPRNLFTVSKKPKLRLQRRKKSTTPPINGLLLASRQCRREYLSVLLSTISVCVEIKDFDFENLIRVSSTLTASEIQSLQSNHNLTLHLHTRNCTQKSLIQLRAWLDFRSSQQDSLRLPWHYEFPLDRLLPPTTMGRVRLLRELEYYADSIATLSVDLEAEEFKQEREELERVIRAHEEKAAWLEDDLGWLGQRSKVIGRNVRGLAGGGLR